MSAGENINSLRLPVPFFDLLMVLLVTCLVFVAPLPDESKTPAEKLEAFDVSIAHGKTGGTSQNLLPVVPRQNGSTWVFESRGEVLDANALRIKAQGHKVVLVVPPATALQDFVDMQTAMSDLGIPFALAIKHKE